MITSGGGGFDPSKLQIEELPIGEGAFGTVYKGKYAGSKEVAVKRIRVSAMKPGDKLKEDFAREVSLLQDLRHTNIVNFVGAINQPAQQQYCIVTEFCANGSLFDMLHQQKIRFPFDQQIEIARGIASGMAYLHDQTIIHRDLKSANILMGKEYTPKICDFGLARVKERVSAAGGGMTIATGTFAWMAPEIMESSSYNEKADIYSFAMVLWEMVTGDTPFEGNEIPYIINFVLREQKRLSLPASAIQSQAAFYKLITQCWSHNSNDRPSFHEIVHLCQNIPNAGVASSATCKFSTMMACLLFAAYFQHFTSSNNTLVLQRNFQNEG